ncbi:MAG TPA: aminotransferase class V-fold PLP-dependent enzyme [Candidatus Acidoferrales bacterium]|nr:aminotransferase class V-fold PLP-dependent enzyme [Candidatus Acidoferrales bacterium]
MMRSKGLETGAGEPLAPAADFPGLQNLTYLNSASVAVTPVPVQRQMQAFQAQIASQGTVGFDDVAESKVYDGARSSVAKLLNANAEDIAIMTSATECLCQIAWWLRPGVGSNVVSIDIEFPSVTYPWLRIAQDTGAEVRLLPAKDDPDSLSLDALARLVDNRTAAVCVSHVQYATGHLLDPIQLAELAHAHKALLVLDTTQSSGVVPLDVRAAKFDVVLSSAYKWLCGPFGAAFCYLHPDIWQRFQPPFVGWHSTVETFNFDATRIPLAKAARRMEYSTVAYAAGLGMAAAIDYLMAIGIERIREHNIALASRLMKGLEALGASILTPRGDSQRAGIVAARFPRRNAQEIVHKLRQAGIICAARLGAVRFSPHLFNHTGQVDHCLEELERVLASRT